MGMDIYGKSGNYFRANVWSWRPIHVLVEQLNQEQNLGLDLTDWGSNDGAGLHSQEDCNRLADALEQHTGKGHKHVVEFADGLRVNNRGEFLRDDEPGGQSPYSTNGEHVLKFVAFLRECGGEFEIC